MIVFWDSKAFGNFFASLIDESVREEMRLEKIRKEEAYKREKEKEQKRLEEYERQKALDQWAFDEAQKNPDEWRVLPYGWSPFGFYL